MDGQVLEVDLRHILAAMGESARASFWTAGPHLDAGEDLWALGEGGVELEALGQSGERVTGDALLAIADRTTQVIWGVFDGHDERALRQPWATIVAYDSSWFEFYSHDQTVLERVAAAFRDVEALPCSAPRF